MPRYTRYGIMLLLTCAVHISIYGQNLVSNSDFEAYNACPWNVGLIDYSPSYTSFPTVKNWVRGTYGTSDYFNTCATIARVLVPDNEFGFQNPHSGDGYAGIYGNLRYSNNFNYREYLITKLNTPMLQDSLYCVRFFVSPTNFKTRIDSTEYHSVAMNELGASLTDTFPNLYVGTYALVLPYAIRNDTSRYLSDTSQWYEIQGVYKARGGELWLTIGCFNPASPDYKYLAGPTNSAPQSYFFIDDVSVDLISGPSQIDSVHDTLIVCAPENRPVELTAFHPTGPYRWNTGDTTRKLLVNQPGVYTCTTLFPCRHYIDHFIVASDSAATPVVHDTMICQHVSAPVFLNNSPGLIWYTDPSNDPGSRQQPVISTAKGNTTTIYVARQERSCISRKMPFSITIKELPPAHPAETGFRCSDGTRSDLSLGKEGALDETFSWSSGDSACCIQPQNPGTYIREASNVCGTAADTFYFRSRECDSCLAFPNAFSPNGDGINDGFRAMEHCGIRDYEMQVYNRWGERVFITNQIKESWNGNHKGSPAPAGNYMYFASFTTSLSDKQYILKGSVLLFR